MAIEADPFDVWGKPADDIIIRLTEKQQALLRRYVRSVTRKAYRLGYDGGYEQGLTVAELAINKRRKRK